MRRTTPLTAAAALGLALLAPTASTATAATAAAELCLSIRPTIVGTGPTVTGTEGRDVIVTGTATSVQALAGDDLICVTATSSTGPVHVDAGAGDDRVLLEDAQLATGSTLAAGSGEDLVVAGRATGMLFLDLSAEGFLIGSRLTSATGFEDAFLSAPRTRIVGDQQDNDLFVNGCMGTVTASGGDDHVAAVRGDVYFGTYLFGCRTRFEMSGGPGDDRLRGGKFFDQLEGAGGDDRIEGLSGDDRLVGGRGRDSLDAGRGRDRLTGGAGHDRLRGGDGHDTLLAGRGRDLADGARGRDRCVAERELRCER